jgi:hypothetical protein
METRTRDKLVSKEPKHVSLVSERRDEVVTTPIQATICFLYPTRLIRDVHNRRIHDLQSVLDYMLSQIVCTFQCLFIFHNIKTNFLPTSYRQDNNFLQLIISCEYSRHYVKNAELISNEQIL